jgi:catechol 2,3-dioxygenase-like lactoylglutathione lyase family enzyme
MIRGIDHIALGVKDIHERIGLFTGALGMTLKRMGTHFATGRPIAFLADPTSRFKIELIEAPHDPPGLLHVAFRVDDVEAQHRSLLAKGFQSIRGPHALGAAKATTALLEDPSGLQIQLIQYAPDSPDL